MLQSAHPVHSTHTQQHQSSAAAAAVSTSYSLQRGVVRKSTATPPNIQINNNNNEGASPSHLFAASAPPPTTSTTTTQVYPSFIHTAAGVLMSHNNNNNGENDNNNQNPNNNVSEDDHQNNGNGNKNSSHSNPLADAMADVDDYDDDGSAGSGGGKGGRNKSRRELPAGAVTTLKAWLLSPEHFTHPYPTPQDQAMLMQKTGIDKKQLKNWFTNARRRIWKPMLKKQIEQGKLTTTGAPGVPGGIPGLIIPSMPGAPPQPPPGASMDNPHSVQAMRVHYQQAVQQQQHDQQQAAAAAAAAAAQAAAQQQHQSQPVDIYGNPLYPPPQPPLQGIDASGSAAHNQYYVSQPDHTSSGQQQQQQGQQHQQQQLHLMTHTSSIGTLPTLPSAANLSKTDSHAVLMELFARDQDLVRQATESARLKAESRLQGTSDSSCQQSQQQQQQCSSQNQSQQPNQQLSQHPMKVQNSCGGGLHNVPTLNSWPHFSSINSLNNLGTIPGVKSITSMSGVDLATKGGVNKMGNLAQVKSMESMGKNDSYAFLEVFFGDRSATNLSSMVGGCNSNGKDSKGMKSSGDNEDNEIGLSLEDESPSHPVTTAKKEFQLVSNHSSSGGGVQPITSMTGASSADGTGGANIESGTLKRAYDDALAARGLMSVSRSCEKLPDLVLPAKMQRTLSQEFINKQQLQKQQQHQGQHQGPQQQQSSYGHFKYTSGPAPPASMGDQSNNTSSSSSSSQYPGQQPVEPNANTSSCCDFADTSETDGHVKVSTTTTCALCQQTNVDTQLRPCGHMFHERCLKPSLQTPIGQPKCPVDNIPMHSAMLAIPTDEALQQTQLQQQKDQDSSQRSWSYSASQQQQAVSAEK